MNITTKQLTSAEIRRMRARLRRRKTLAVVAISSLLQYSVSPIRRLADYTRKGVLKISREILVRFVLVCILISQYRTLINY